MNGKNYEVPHCEAFSYPHSNPSWKNIRLRILFSNTLSLDSSLVVRDHVLQPYSTTGNIIVLYITFTSTYSFIDIREIIRTYVYSLDGNTRLLYTSIPDSTCVKI